MKGLFVHQQTFSRYIKRGLLIGIAASFVLTQNTYAAQPLSGATLRKMGIYFTGKTVQGCVSSGTTATATSATPKNIYVIGDSITARSASSYQTAFSGKGSVATIDASSSRSITVAGTDGNKLSGLDAIDAEGKKTPSALANANAIVIALGTNGSTTTANILTFINKLKSYNAGIAGKTTKVYWVDTTSIGRPDYVSVIKAANTAIYDQSSVQGYTVISWYKAVTPSGDPKNPGANDTDQNNYIVQADQYVHPTPEGITALTSLVVNAVSGSGVSAASATSCCSVTPAATLTATVGADTGSGITGVFYGGTKTLPTSWVPILKAAATTVGIDPAFLAAILGNETGWIAPEAFLQNPNLDSHGNIAGPFQFDTRYTANLKKDLTLDGNKDGIVDEKNPYDAAYMAAAFLKSMGASPTVPLGNTGDYAVSRNNSDGKVTVRTIAAHYNQGGGFNAPNAKTAADVNAVAVGKNDVAKYMDQAQQNTDSMRKSAAFGGAAGSVSNAGCSSTLNTDSFISYSQSDPRWANEPYGKYADGSIGTIKAGGCGPSAMAMIITALTGKQVTPLDTAKYGRQHGTEDNNGGSLVSKLATELAAYGGLSAAPVAAELNAINDVLANSGMVIIGGHGSNPFTEGGHYIVIRGRTPEGKWLIGDSNIEANNKLEFDTTELLAKATKDSAYAITRTVK